MVKREQEAFFSPTLEIGAPAFAAERHQCIHDMGRRRFEDDGEGGRLENGSFGRRESSACPFELG